MNDYTVIGYEYPSDESAGDAFERAYGSLKHISLFRTTTPERDRWFVLGVSQDPVDFDWGADAKPYVPSADQVDWMVGRRFGRAFQAAVAGEGEVNERRHYGPGVEVRIPGGAS